MFFRRLVSLAVLLSTIAVFSFAPQAVLAQTTPKPTIVLVHGAWADASSWSTVIPLLQKAGFTVYAPPNTLRSLPADAAVIATFLKSIPGPVVLVGHSYGGSVISVASATSPNVKALVYVDAFVPAAGESPQSLLSAYPPPPSDFLVQVPLPTGDGVDFYIAQKYYGPVFASDVPPAMASVMAVTQRPFTAAAFTGKAPQSEGWTTIPSWYVLGDADRVIPPALQLMMATRAKSHVSHVPGGSHPSMIMHPQATADAIMAAAASTMN